MSDTPPPLSAFAESLGMRLISQSPEEVIGELPVTETLVNINGTLHGGALMSLADTLGGFATLQYVADGQTTTTIESKTNFFRPIHLGDVARGRAVPLNVGRTFIVWQTEIFRGDGKLAAVVTQTQMLLTWSGS
ncbi:MAG: PaaI family thioesterase [Rhodobacteraceae bacterium]|nr:PaaI family thioesterase [Paracoccaceae bacterium]